MGKVIAPWLLAILFLVYLLFVFGIFFLSGLARRTKNLPEEEKPVLQEVFPSFTSTQISIARLVIRGKTNAEIGKALGKSSNNISVQRSYMRRKLSLPTGTDLHTALTQAVERYGRGEHILHQ